MEQAGARHNILIAGLGNLLLQDDGVGVHVVQALQQDPDQDGVVVAEIGAAVLRATHLLEWADRIIALDAVKAGGAPGTVYLMDGADAQRTQGPQSMHELNLTGAYQFLPEGHRPRVTVVGVEPAVIDYGLELTPAVAAAVPRVAETVRAIVQTLRTNFAAGLEELLPAFQLQAHPVAPEAAARD